MKSVFAILLFFKQKINFIDKHKKFNKVKYLNVFNNNK